MKYIQHTLSFILLLAFFMNSADILLNELKDNKTSAYEMADKTESKDEKSSSEKDSKDEKYQSTSTFSPLKSSKELISHQYIFALPKITLGIFIPPPEVA